MTQRTFLLVLAAFLTLGQAVADSGDGSPLDLGSHRELFVDNYLIDSMNNMTLVLQTPQDEGTVFDFDKPWEGRFSSFCTLIKDGENFRLYYNTLPMSGDPGVVAPRMTICMAESADGVHWTRPNLKLFEVNGTRENSVVIDGPSQVAENFTPLLDTRPGVPPAQRYKGLGGAKSTGLIAYVSADGINWRRLQEEPVLPTARFERPNTLNVFDSQNVAFWSSAEKQYVCYYRVFKDDVRRIARTTSSDFINWSDPILMEYRHPHREAPVEHLYTNQTQPYFRAPHLYVATPARLVFNRPVVSLEQAKAIGQHPWFLEPSFLEEVSDSVFMTSRDYVTYDRTFLEGHLRPGIGPRHWVSRANFPALNIVQTSPTEMSLYVNHHYGQLSNHLRRYSLRLDGFASVHAGFEEGEMRTKPLTFAGKRLLLNYSTSAVGSLRVEMQDASGVPLPGYALEDSRPLIGNEIEKSVHWESGDSLEQLAGKTVRLKFVMADADLYALRFE